MSGSPPRSGTAGATLVNTVVTKVEISNVSENLGHPWNGQLQQRTRDPASSTSVESKHVVLNIKCPYFYLLLSPMKYENFAKKGEREGRINLMAS